MANIIYPRNLELLFFSSSSPHPGKSLNSLSSLSSWFSPCLSLRPVLVRAPALLTWTMEQEPPDPLPPGGSEVYEGAQALTSEGPGLNSHLHQAPGGKLGGLSWPLIDPTGHCEDSQKGARQSPANAVFAPTLPAQSTLPETCNKQLSLSVCSGGWLQDPLGVRNSKAATARYVCEMAAGSPHRGLRVWVRRADSNGMALLA